MPEEDLETIWVITDETPQITQEDGAKSGTSPGNPYSPRSTLATVTSKGVKVSTQKLEAEMSRFLSVVGGLFNRAQQQVNQQSGLKLDEIELSVEVNGEGEVKLLGSGGKAGTKGAITLKFKRADS
ncbi:MAG TPA: hypothetical protein DCE56_16035 [Cyanobacteria bacterium UBA8553]|nr:hypothetical protein [Cyanobacteria bacterium UBA8553]HAJ61444.1 hypothetical protein [Cyanobacteria bacterium UBA8543]